MRFSQGNISQESGFGVGIIMALVLLLALATTIMSRQMENTMHALNHYAATHKTMDAIEQAIAAYAMNNAGNLPCPASRTHGDNEDLFGISEGFVAGSPNTSCAGATVANTGRVQSTAGNSPRLRTGAIPNITLGLPHNMAFDAWGNRFTYTIVEDFGYDFAGFSATHADKFIAVLDGASGSLLPDISATSQTVVGYVIVSHGENGHGAYTRTGDIISGCTSSKVHERENCTVDDTYVKTSLTRQDAADADLFDDIVRYKMYK